MVKQQKTVPGQSGGAEKARSPARQDRLEAALRENLKRRRKQARARAESETPSEDAELPQKEK